MIRWTGHGWVGALLWFTVPPLALWLAFAVAGDAVTPVMIAFAVLTVVIGVPAQVLVGRRLNTRQTPDGPQRHLDHSLMGVPVQRSGWFYGVLALIAFGVALRGHPVLIGLLAVAGLVALAVYYGWASREYRAAQFDTSSPDGALIAARAAGIPYAAARTSAELAGAGDQPKRERGANPELLPVLAERWPAYKDEVPLLTPAGVSTGTAGGMRYTVFDTMIKEGGWRDQYQSMRTVCAVHLPVALPDVRLRPRLIDEERLLGGDMPAVALEPPWNCDLLIRLRAIDLLQDGLDPTPELTAEADEPEFAGRLVTPPVVAASVRHGILHWRVHGPDLLYVSFPGPGFRLSAAEVMAVVDGLVDIARSFPPATLRHYGYN